MQDQGDEDLLAADAGGDTYSARLRDRGMRQERPLDLPRRDVLPAPADRVPETINEVQPALIVEVSPVAGVEPQVTPGPHRGRGVVEVLAEHQPGQRGP